MALSKELIGEIQIIISIVFFGCSFVGQKYAMNKGIGPLTYNAGRFIVSTFLLIISKPYLLSVMDCEFDDDNVSDSEEDGVEKEIISEEQAKWNEFKDLWWYGSLCGLSNTVGSVLLQVSLLTISVAKAGFITGMYVVAVPLVEWIIPGHKSTVTVNSVIAALVSMIGMYFLSGCTEGTSCLDTSQGHGEILVFISMWCWVVSIMAADYGSKKVDCVSLTLVDFLICTVFNIILAIIFEPEEWKYPFTNIINNWFPIVIVGFTEASAFLLSTMGQMYTPPSRAALLMSLEAVSSALGGYLVLHELLSPVEVIGCLLMFGATLVSTLEYHFNLCLSPQEIVEQALMQDENSSLLSYCDSSNFKSTGNFLSSKFKSSDSLRDYDDISKIVVVDDLF